MRFRQVEFFLTIAEQKSFSKAAEQCGATQSTLSNSLSQLEAELDGRLFSRTTRMVKLTPYGKYLLPYFQSILDGRSELMAAVKSYRNPNHRLIKIGFSPLVDMQKLNQLLAPFSQQHQDVQFFFKECVLGDIYERLANKVIDFAIIPIFGDEKDYRSFEFYQDDLLYLPMGDEGIISNPLKISDLPDDPVILTGGGCGLNGALHEIFNALGCEFASYPGQAISYPVIEEWAELGIGAGILPSAKVNTTKERAILLNIDGKKTAKFSFDWIWDISSETTDHIRDFVNYFKTTVPLLIKGGHMPAE